MKELDELAERHRAWKRWSASQERLCERWYLASQTCLIAGGAWSLACLIADWSGWLGWAWLLLIPPAYACRWAWKEAHRRLMEGGDHYIVWLDSYKKRMRQLKRERG